MTIHDHLISALAISAQNESVENRQNLVKKIAGQLLGVEVDIKASPVTDLNSALNPRVSLVEIRKMEVQVEGAANLNDRDLENFILLTLKEKGAMPRSHLCEKMGLSKQNRRVAVILKSLVDCNLVIHTGKRQFSRYSLA